PTRSFCTSYRIRARWRAREAPHGTARPPDLRPGIRASPRRTLADVEPDEARGGPGHRCLGRRPRQARQPRPRGHRPPAGPALDRGPVGRTQPTPVEALRQALLEPLAGAEAR